MTVQCINVLLIWERYKFLSYDHIIDINLQSQLRFFIALNVTEHVGSSLLGCLINVGL